MPRRATSPAAARDGQSDDRTVLGGISTLHCKIALQKAADRVVHVHAPKRREASLREGRVDQEQKREKNLEAEGALGAASTLILGPPCGQREGDTLSQLESSFGDAGRTRWRQSVASRSSSSLIGTVSSTTLSHSPLSSSIRVQSSEKNPT